MVGVFVQTFISGGVKTEGGFVKLIITTSLAGAQPPVEVNVKVTVPAAASVGDGV
jgi:hypothetical protein